MAGIDARREKAKMLRYKKPIVRNMNLDFIRDDLYEIQEACEDVRWFTENEDGTDTLVCAIGDDGEASEFRFMFADLCAEVETMLSDLQEAYVPDCFNDFFVAIHAGAMCGGLLGFDAYEQDYFGLDVPMHWSEEISANRIMRLNKKELLEAAACCFKVYSSYIALRSRYDDLKSSMDILREENLGYNKTVKKIEELYQAMQGCEYDNAVYKATAEWDEMLKALPQEAWLY